MHQLINRELVRTRAFPQRFKRDIKTNPVSVLEAVGDRPRDRVDLDRNALETMAFDTLMIGRSGGAEYPETAVPRLTVIQTSNGACVVIS